MKVIISVEVPEGSLPLYGIGIVLTQAADGEMIVTHSEESNVDADESIPLMQSLGMLEMTKNTMLHPPQEGD